MIQNRRTANRGARRLKNTLVIQSHRMPLPAPWMQRCLDSVRAWAEARGFDYRFLDDELFDLAPDWLREKTSERRMVTADFARLIAIRRALAEGYESAVWCDADFLIFAADRLHLPAESYAFGREVWIEADAKGTPRANVKIHNAFMLFRGGNPFLDFYIHAAQRLLRAHVGPVVPQFIGPKFLTSIHNMLQCPVVESAGMLSPPVVRDLLGGGGRSLELLRRRSPVCLAGVNLCASLATSEGMTNDDFVAVIDLLSAQPEMLRALA